MSFITEWKKRILCTSVLQCRMLQCQTWEDKAWSEIPVPKSGNQPSHVLLWERQNRPSCQDWEQGRCSWEDISSEMLQWNLSSRSEVRAAAKPSLSIWAPQLEILHWKQTTHFCCVKVLKCMCESVCVCVSVSFEMRGLKGGGWLSSAPYHSPSNQQHSGQNKLSQRRHRVKSLLIWKETNSVPLVTLIFEQKATPEDQRLQENKEEMKKKT